VLLHNLALHTVSTLLIFFFLAGTTGATGASAFVAAVFAIHPLHVESVAWATERKDALSGVFFMLALLAHAYYAARPSWLRYAPLLLAVAAGLLAKPMLVTLPCVLLLLDAWPLSRLRLGTRLVWEKLPLFALAAAVAVTTWMLQDAAGATSYGQSFGLDARVANAIDATVFYLQKSFWPSGLAAFYPFSTDTLTYSRVAAEALLLAIISGVALWSAGRTPALLVGWLWFLGMLVPVIGIVQVGEQGRADRYTYLPMVGLSIAVTWGMLAVLRGRIARGALAGAAGVAVAALAFSAWLQVGTWRSSELLFERAALVARESGFVQLRLATLRLRAGELEAAEQHYQRFFELRPEEGRARLVRFHLGMADQLLRSGDEPGALRRYRRAIEVDPNHPRANALLGMALLDAGAPLEARPFLMEARREWPETVGFHLGLAAAANIEGRFATAVWHWREALRLDSAQHSARNNLAWLLATCPDPNVRDPAAAVQLAEELVVVRPDAQPLDTLGAAYASAGRFDEALEQMARAIARAEEDDAPELASVFRQRLEQYARGEPWIEAPLAPGAP
jgi:Flp pilus assembly protein TadD